MIPLIVISLLLVMGSAFFVAAEYSLVSSRKSRLESLAKKGNRGAGVLAKELDNLSRYVACSQIGITMLGIGVGSVTEPFVTDLITSLFGHALDRRLSYAVSFLLVAFVLVVVGELVPKYATLRDPERTALYLFPALRVVTLALRPLIWLAQSVSSIILKLFGVEVGSEDHDVMPKEELLLLVQTGGAEGVLDKKHAELVTRALKLDVLTARDVMVHRLDIKWLDVACGRAEVLTRLKEIPYSRIPVCRGDIDDLIGVVYVHDIIRNLDSNKFNLESLATPPIAVPENLPMERIVGQMREARTQILIVMDEYGGTSGLITLEDVVEEVFGDLEDRIESERPPIERSPNGRITARADVRYDELIQFLGLPVDAGDNTDSLATLVVDELERIPKPGDSVETPIGTLRVENMARRRITRIAVVLKPEFLGGGSEAGR